MKIDGLHISGGHRLLPPPGFLGITLFGRVWTRHSREELAAFLQTERGRVFVNHERIHLIQARMVLAEAVPGVVSFADGLPDQPL